jgi:hypothetical protein
MYPRPGETIWAALAVTANEKSRAYRSATAEPIHREPTVGISTLTDDIKSTCVNGYRTPENPMQGPGEQI